MIFQVIDIAESKNIQIASLLRRIVGFTVFEETAANEIKKALKTFLIKNDVNS